MNPTLFGMYLSLLLPIVLVRRGWGWLIASLSVMGMVVLTQSRGAMVAMAVSTTWVLWHRTRWMGLGLLGLSLLVSLLSLGHLDWWGSSERVASLRAAVTTFLLQNDHAGYGHHPITGYGPGFLFGFIQNLGKGHGPLNDWHHLHNEWLQAWIEYGLIGVGFLLWGTWDIVQRVWRAQKTPLVIALTGILLAFTVNSLVQFPAHLWLTSSVGLLAYCGLYVVTTTA